MDWNCVIVDDIVEINEIIVGLLIILNYSSFFCCKSTSWIIYFVDGSVLLKWMYLMQEMKNCVLNILINDILNIKYMSNILFHLN